MRFLLFMITFFSGLACFAQENALPPVDKSPMDMSYYPVNYPVLKIRRMNNEPLIARLIYSRPQKSGRVVFGDLREYGKIWRLGANEATEIEFFKEVKWAGKKIKKGRYTLYAIPYPDKWTIILNRETDTWGDFIYDPAKDVIRTEIPVQKTSDNIEVFTMMFSKTNEHTFTLDMLWDNIKVSLPISY